MTAQTKPSSTYDVAIIGGGPAGSTLGALLARKTSLKVAIFERDEFPREHIGESFSHPLVPVLEESGAIEKVLKSECYVIKYGGVYHWDPGDPAVVRFGHRDHAQDGIVRWSLHVNRAEFDEVLLDHAQDLGVSVFEGANVETAVREGSEWVLTLGDATKVRARVAVDATGRLSSLLTKAPKEYLSQYKNVAIWNYVTDARPVQYLPGGWNIFRNDNHSPIGNFAFQDGWFWYIPIPKLINGQRHLVHSLGLVTDPQVLKDGRDYTNVDVFMRKANEIPLLKELIKGATVVSEKPLTATNYSMISGQFCDFDTKMVQVGDAAYFVDPLYSNGVAFAMQHSLSACLMIKETLEGSLDEASLRDLWFDYDREWHGAARSFALALDQWYHAISENNPGSVYWSRRSEEDVLCSRKEMFFALVDTDSVELASVLHTGKGDVGSGEQERALTETFYLLKAMTRGTDRAEDMGKAGPLTKAREKFYDDWQPQASDRVSIKSNVAIREGASLGVGLRKAKKIPGQTSPTHEDLTLYWAHPVKYGSRVPSVLEKTQPCFRFIFEDGSSSESVKFFEKEDGQKVFNLLREPRTYKELAAQLSAKQCQLVLRLFHSGMLERV